ncbi:hypothetical protein BJ085DRAFT_34051 [Dimargaris cristalligena]|uniref:Retrotransposon gag domain-containing protein n=1 Tax=Dimargaris cristalligena TaxID=215637 RepID=A0A4P9ZL84_9FUNG|nr:hypothetical protein BJ085DRAFT_34051 [Dimargaris cristalligena]|eukprot:RKP33241.1 hypothetical protein BJ085DRAFT_34051 [Dimargaris cristalligena]
MDTDPSQANLQQGLLNLQQQLDQQKQQNEQYQQQFTAVLQQNEVMVAKLSQLLDQNITSTVMTQETAQGARQMAQKADSTARKAGKRAEDAGETAIRAGQTAELAGSTTQRAGTTAAQASATAQQAGTLAQQAGTTVTQVQSAMADTGRGEILETYGHPKPERVDAFTGGIHENVQMWLEKARNQSKGLFPTEAKQIEHVSRSLDHRALRWFNDEESGGHYFTQWQDFQDSIMEAFYDPTITRRLRSKLKQIHFRGNIERFTTKSILCMLMALEWGFVTIAGLEEIVGIVEDHYPRVYHLHDLLTIKLILVTLYQSTGILTN